jgi:hypothetical protein
MDGELASRLLNYHVVLMAIGAWVVLWALRKIWKGMDNISIVRRLKPLYAAALCEGFVWIPGVLPEATVGDRILTALWSGFLAAIGYQLLRRIIRLKIGIELPEDPNKLEPGGTPAEDKSEPEEEEEDEEVEVEDVDEEESSGEDDKA